MHELSIAMSLIEVASRHAPADGAGSIRRVNLVLGSLAGVETEALEFCFPVAARGTPCEGAELHITLVPATGTCPRCETVGEVHDLLAPCPSCGEWPVRVEGGREMRLESLEVT